MLNKEKMTNSGITTDWRIKYRIPFKIIAVTLMAAFLLYDISWAQGGTSLWQHSKVNSRNTGLETGNIDLTVPSNLASVDTAYNNGGDKKIINIQDSHGSLSAQYSIVNVLDTIVTNYDVNIIAVEGSEGYIDTSIFRTFPVDEIKQEEMELLMKEGRMSAGEFFAITSENPIALYGIEDDELYSKNLALFEEAMEDRDKCIEQLNELDSTLSLLAYEIFNHKLGSFLHSARLHREGQISFAKYWEDIQGWSKEDVEIERHENIKKLLQTIELEKEIDFESAHSERQSLIGKLNRDIGKEGLKLLVYKTIAFEKGEITKLIFHEDLISIAGKYGVPSTSYKNLIKYTEYLSAYDRIDMVRLAREIEDIEHTLRSKLYRSQKERKLYELMYKVKVLKDLFNVSLSNGEFDYFMLNRKKMSARDFTGFIDRNIDEYMIAPPDYDLEYVFQKIPRAIELYNTVEERNNAMIRNTLRGMREEKQDVACLISGGFHSKGLSKIMKDDGLSYLILAPKFQPGKERPYIAVLTSREEPYLDLVKSGQYELAIHQYLSTGNLEDVIPSVMRMLKNAGEKANRVKAEWKQFYRGAYEVMDPSKRQKAIIEPDDFDRLMDMFSEDAIQRLSEFRSVDGREILRVVGYHEHEALPEYNRLMADAERLSRVDAFITDFAGVDKDHGLSSVADETVAAKRGLSDRGAHNITITGESCGKFFKKLRVRGMPGINRAALMCGKTKYTVANSSGAVAHTIDRNGIPEGVIGYEQLSLGNKLKIRRIRRVAKKVTVEVLRENNLPVGLADNIHILSSKYGVTLYTGEKGLDPRINALRAHIAERIRAQINDLIGQSKLSGHISVAHSAAAVDIMATSKGYSAIQIIKAYKLKNIVLMGDCVGTEEHPGNDRSLLEITQEDLAKAGVDWDVDLIKIYVGREDDAELPEGVVRAPVLSIDREIDPALRVYRAVIDAKDRKDTSGVYKSGYYRVVDRLKQDFLKIMKPKDEHRWNTIEYRYRIKHTKYAIKAYEEFIKGREGFPFIYESIGKNPVVRRNTPDKEEYFKLLDRAYDIYLSLTGRERAELYIATILHDVGFRETSKGADHWTFGEKEVEGVLREYGVEDDTMIANIKEIVLKHGMTGDVGLTFFPSDFDGMSDAMKTQIFLVTIIDTISKLDREPPFLPDSNLSSKFLDEIMYIHEHIKGMEKKDFCDLRLRFAGIPLAFLLSRGTNIDGRLKTYELENDEYEYMRKKARRDPVLIDMWSGNLKNQIFPIFMLLRQGKGKGLGRVTKTYKLMELFAYIGRLYIERISGKFDENMLTLDVVGDDTSDSFYQAILDGMKGFFDMDDDELSLDAVRDELGKNSWDSAFGLNLTFEDNKILLRRPGQKSLSDETLPESPKSAIHWLNLAAVVAFLIMTFYFGWFGLGDSYINKGIVSALAILGVLIHEYSHWADTSFAPVRLRDMVNKHGISIPGSAGRPGIVASFKTAFATSLFIPAFPQLAIPALLVNLILTASITDWRDVFKKYPRSPSQEKAEYRVNAWDFMMSMLFTGSSYLFNVLLSNINVVFIGSLFLDAISATAIYMLPLCVCFFMVTKRLSAPEEMIGMLRRDAMDVPDNGLLDIAEMYTNEENRLHCERMMRLYDLLDPGGLGVEGQAVRKLFVAQAADSTYNTEEMRSKKPKAVEYPIRALAEHGIMVRKDSGLGFWMHGDIFRDKAKALRAIKRARISNKERDRRIAAYVLFCITDSIEQGSDYIKKLFGRARPKFDTPKEAYDFQRDKEFMGDKLKRAGLSIDISDIIPEDTKEALKGASQELLEALGCVDANGVKDRGSWEILSGLSDTELEHADAGSIDDFVQKLPKADPERLRTLAARPQFNISLRLLKIAVEAYSPAFEAGFETPLGPAQTDAPAEETTSGGAAWLPFWWYIAYMAWLETPLSFLLGYKGAFWLGNMIGLPLVGIEFLSILTIPFFFWFLHIGRAIYEYVKMEEKGIGAFFTKTSLFSRSVADLSFLKLFFASTIPLFGFSSALTVYAVGFVTLLHIISNLCIPEGGKSEKVENEPRRHMFLAGLSAVSFLPACHFIIRFLTNVFVRPPGLARDEPRRGQPYWGGEIPPDMRLDFEDQFKGMPIPPAVPGEYGVVSLDNGLLNIRTDIAGDPIDTHVNLYTGTISRRERRPRTSRARLLLGPAVCDYIENLIRRLGVPRPKEDERDKVEITNINVSGRITVYAERKEKWSRGEIVEKLEDPHLTRYINHVETILEMLRYISLISERHDRNKLTPIQYYLHRILARARAKAEAAKRRKGISISELSISFGIWLVFNLLIGILIIQIHQEKWISLWAARILMIISAVVSGLFIGFLSTCLFPETKVIGKEMSRDGALEIMRSPEFGIKNTGAIMFKMGVPEELRREIIGRLEDSGIDCYRLARVEEGLDWDTILRLWGDGLKKSIETLRGAGLESGELDEGEMYLTRHQGNRFREWVGYLYGNKDKYSREIKKAISVLRYSLICLSRGVEVVILESRVSRRKLAAEYGGVDLLAEKLGRRPGFNYENHRKVRFQDFLKHVIVGATDVAFAGSGTLRRDIIERELHDKRLLASFVELGKKMNVSDSVTLIVNGIHSADYSALSDGEIDIYRAIYERMKDENNIINLYADDIMRDTAPSVKNHILRVAKIARLIAKRLGMSEKDITLLERAAWAHDIGQAVRHKHPEALDRLTKGFHALPVERRTEGTLLGLMRWAENVAPLYSEIPEEELDTAKAQLEEGNGYPLWRIFNVYAVLGKTELTKEEEIVCRNLFNHGRSSVAVLDERGYSYPDIVGWMITHHHDYHALDLMLKDLAIREKISERDMRRARLMTASLIVADSFEQGNNHQRLVQMYGRPRIDMLFETEIWINRRYTELEDIDEYRPLEALRALLIERDPELMRVMFEARASSDLLPRDYGYMETQKMAGMARKSLASADRAEADDQAALDFRMNAHDLRTSKAMEDILDRSYETFVSYELADDSQGHMLTVGTMRKVCDKFKHYHDDHTAKIMRWAMLLHGISEGRGVQGAGPAKSAAMAETVLSGDDIEGIGDGDRQLIKWIIENLNVLEDIYNGEKKERYLKQVSAKSPGSLRMKNMVLLLAASICHAKGTLHKGKVGGSLTDEKVRAWLKLLDDLDRESRPGQLPGDPVGRRGALIKEMKFVVLGLIAMAVGISAASAVVGAREGAWTFGEGLLPVATFITGLFLTLIPLIMLCYKSREDLKFFPQGCARPLWDGLRRKERGNLIDKIKIALPNTIEAGSSVYVKILNDYRKGEPKSQRMLATLKAILRGKSDIQLNIIYRSENGRHCITIDTITLMSERDDRAAEPERKSEPKDITVRGLEITIAALIPSLFFFIYLFKDFIEVPYLREALAVIAFIAFLHLDAYLLLRINIKKFIGVSIYPIASCRVRHDTGKKYLWLSPKFSKLSWPYKMIVYLHEMAHFMPTRILSSEPAAYAFPLLGIFPAIWSLFNLLINRHAVEIEKEKFDPEEANKRVRTIAYKNLAFEWDYRFQALKQRGEDLLDEMREPAFNMRNYDDFMLRYQRYLRGSQKQIDNSKDLRLSEKERIIYFSMEYGLTNDMNTYSGGLGMLSGDHLRAASDRYSKDTFVAVGLAWKNGYFRQRITKDGRQESDFVRIPFDDYSELVMIRDEETGREKPLVIKVEAPGIRKSQQGQTRYMYAKVRKVMVGRTALYLLDTDIKDQEIEEYGLNIADPWQDYKELTARLYPPEIEQKDKKRWRFAQEYLLGIGGMRLLEELHLRPAAVHLNEGHAAFAPIELLRWELEKRARTIHPRLSVEAYVELMNSPSLREIFDVDFKPVLEAVRARVGFTTHTPVSAGNETFAPDDVFAQYFKHYCRMHGLMGYYDELMKTFVFKEGPDGEAVHLPKALIWKYASKSNAVSRKHLEVSRELYKLDDGREPAMTYVTNSVHRGFWQRHSVVGGLLETNLCLMRGVNPDRPPSLFKINNSTTKTLDDLDEEEIDELLGVVSDVMLIGARNLMKKAAAERLWEICERKRRGLIEDIHADGKQTEAEIVAGLFDESLYPDEDKEGQMKYISGDSDTFTIVIARRFAQYKRLGMLLGIDDSKGVEDEKFEGAILDDLIKECSERGLKLQVIFAGKAHPAAGAEKDIIAKIHKAMKHKKEWNESIFFIPDYDIEIARCLIELATIWQNNPVPGQEASGTSGMKAAANGVFSVSTPDGWVLEADSGYEEENTATLFETVEDLKEVYLGEHRTEQVSRDRWGEQKTVTCDRGLIDLYSRTLDSSDKGYHRWAERMKKAIKDYLMHFNMPRFLGEYDNIYRILIDGGRRADETFETTRSTRPSFMDVEPFGAGARHAFRLVSNWSWIALGGGLDWVIIPVNAVVSVWWFCGVIPGLLTALALSYFFVTALYRATVCLVALKAALPELFDPRMKASFIGRWRDIFTYDIGNDVRVLRAIRKISPYVFSQVLSHEAHQSHVAGLWSFIAWPVSMRRPGHQVYSLLREYVETNVKLDSQEEIDKLIFISEILGDKHAEHECRENQGEMGTYRKLTAGSPVDHDMTEHMVRASKNIVKDAINKVTRLHRREDPAILVAVPHFSIGEDNELVLISETDEENVRAYIKKVCDRHVRVEFLRASQDKGDAGNLAVASSLAEEHGAIMGIPLTKELAKAMILELRDGNKTPELSSAFIEFFEIVNRDLFRLTCPEAYELDSTRLDMTERKELESLEKRLARLLPVVAPIGLSELSVGNMRMTTLSRRTLNSYLSPGAVSYIGKEYVHDNRIISVRVKSIGEAKMIAEAHRSRMRMAGELSGISKAIKLEIRIVPEDDERALMEGFGAETNFRLKSLMGLETMDDTIFEIVVEDEDEMPTADQRMCHLVTDKKYSENNIAIVDIYNKGRDRLTVPSEAVFLEYRGLAVASVYDTALELLAHAGNLTWLKINGLKRLKKGVNWFRFLPPVESYEADIIRREIEYYRRLVAAAA